MPKSTQFNIDSEETKKFLTSKPKDKLADFAAKLGSALEKPDGEIKPKENNVVREQISNLENQVAREDTSDMALTTPQNEPRKVGRPLSGKKPKVEKTYAIDEETHTKLVRISNLDGLRLNKKLSVSAILQHIVDYGLSHVQDEKVIPGEDGRGLIVEQGEAK